MIATCRDRNFPGICAAMTPVPSLLLIMHRDVRRPDMCMPVDPDRPANPVDNMEAVVEIKFGDDPPDPDQDEDYRTIAGDKEKYFRYRCGGPLRDGEIGSDCNDPGWPSPWIVPLRLSGVFGLLRRSKFDGGHYQGKSSLAI